MKWVRLTDHVIFDAERAEFVYLVTLNDGSKAIRVQLVGENDWIQSPVEDKEHATVIIARVLADLNHNDELAE